MRAETTFDQGLERLRDETDALLGGGLRSTIVVVLSALGLLAVGDMQIHQPFVAQLFLHKLLLSLVGIASVVALRLPQMRPWFRAIGVVFLGATVVSAAVQGAITGDAVTPAPIYMALTIGVSAIVPWGMRAQAVLALVAAASVIANSYAVTGSVAGSIGYSLLIAALSTFLASVYLAYFFEQQRLAYSRQGIQLANAAASTGEERFVGANDGLWDWSIEFGDVYFSARWREIVGIADTATGLSLDAWRQRIHPDDSAAFEADLLAHLSGATPLFRNEHRVRHDGSDHWVLARGQATRDTRGNALRVAGSLTDISERKQIEHALHESEIKYRDMVENLNDVIFTIDTDGRYTYVSPAIEAMTGYRPEELTGRSQLELIHGDDVPHVVDTTRRTTRPSGHEVDEFRLRTRAGGWLWVRSNGRAIVSDGAVTGMRGTLTDITDRKRAEEEKAAVIELSRDIGGTLDVSEILDRVHPRVAAALACDAVFTFWWNPDRRAYTAAGQYGCPDHLIAEVMALEYAADDPLVAQLGEAGTSVISDNEQLARFRCASLIVTPLMVRGRADGACCAAMLDPSGPRFEPAQAQLLEAMARQVALALEAADLYSHQKEEARVSAALAAEKSVLLEVARDASGLDIGMVLRRVHPHLITTIPCDGVVTLGWEASHERYRVLATHSAHQQAEEIIAWEFCRALPIAERLSTAGTVVINDAQKQRWLPARALDELGIEAMVVAPLVVREGDIRGACCIYNRTGGPRFSAAQVQLFEGVTRHIALAMEASELYAAQQEDAKVSAALAQFSQQMIASAHEPDLLDRLCHLTLNLLGCDASYTFLHDAETDEYLPVAHCGGEPEHWEALRVLRYPRSMMAEFDRLLERDGLADLLIESPFEQLPPNIGELMREMGVSRALSVRLQRGDETFAVHHAVRRGGTEPFTERQRRILRGIAQVAPLALEAARLFDELQTANQVKEHFVATLTHELRNPISAISGYHFLVLDGDAPLTTEQKDWIESAERCTAELGAVIRATLDLSRFQAKRVAVDWQELSIAELMTDLSREIRAPADKPALQLSWDAAAGLEMIQTDRLKLKMALRNLVTNAIKFTEQGHVSLRVQARDGGVEFRVSDTGIGIPAQALPTLFEPFTQAHGIVSRRKGGVGLGLHLVQRLVEVLGGTVTVDTQVGRGSTFRLWLPCDGMDARNGVAEPSAMTALSL